jgi:hypothetical protein
MDAPAPRAPGGRVVQAAKEVAKPRTWHAVAEGSAALENSGSTGPGLCRRARKPRRGSIVGRVARPTFGSGRDDATVRGCRDTSS